MSESSTKPTPGFSAFYAHYGFFFAVWSSCEMLVEVLIMHQLGLIPKTNSIVCGPLGFGAKINLLYSLLNRHPSYAEGVALLRKMHTIAERNALAHGMMLSPPDKSHFILFKRDVKEKYTVTPKAFTAETMKERVQEVLSARLAAQDWFGVSQGEIDQYGQSIAADAPDRTIPVPRHPESQTSSQTSKS